MEETIVIPMKGRRKKILKKILDKEPEMIPMIDLLSRVDVGHRHRVTSSTKRKRVT